MRDQRFVAIHRGGLLSKENHQKLMNWARQCAHHILYLADGSKDERLNCALQVAEDWENDQIKTGAAMKASKGAHAAAREAADPVSTAVCRSTGHVVATAHMADHSLGAALYALKAVMLAGGLIDQENEWIIHQLQQQQLPADLEHLILDTLTQKMKRMKIG